MLSEAERFSTQPDAGVGPLRVGVTSGLRPLPAWKQDADFLFVQVGFSVDELVAWRASVDFDGPVYAGVMVVASAAMAHKLSATIPQIAVPSSVVSALEADPAVGIDVACDLISAIDECRAFEGVHLIPIGRYREMAARLESRR
jgi:5,10-methylenetetrahydrofolate reductase